MRALRGAHARTRLPHPTRAVALAALGALALSYAPATHVVAAWKDPHIERATVARPLPGAVAAYVLPSEEI